MKNIQSFLTTVKKRVATANDSKRQGEPRIDYDFQAAGLEFQAYFCPDPGEKAPEDIRKRWKREKSRLWQLFHRYELQYMWQAFSSCRERGKPFIGYFVFLLQLEQWRVDHPYYQELWRQGKFQELRERFEARRRLYRKADTEPMVAALKSLTDNSKV